MLVLSSGIAIWGISSLLLDGIVSSASWREAQAYRIAVFSDHQSTSNVLFGEYSNLNARV
jgi:hypothetical protein